MQSVTPQVYGAHCLTGIAMQAPWPSHAELFVAPLPHVGVPQDVPSAGYAHAARLVPSHVPPHAVALPAHAGRPPWGVPVTATQVPSEPATSQASH